MIDLQIQSWIFKGTETDFFAGHRACPCLEGLTELISSTSVLDVAEAG